MYFLNFASLQTVEDVCVWDVSLVLMVEDDDDWIVKKVLGYNARHGYIRMRVIIRIVILLHIVIVLVIIMIILRVVK